LTPEELQLADPQRRLEANAPGAWFVDETCIDCDACRQIAPEIFGDGDGHALVIRQPDEDHRADAFRALTACPVAAIGSGRSGPPPRELFPQLLDDGVFYCGYNASSSYGANSFFVQRPAGNVLVDSPRWAKLLVRQIEQRGGIADILLTHQDDVAAADRYQRHFDARVWIHRADRRAAPYASDLLDGEAAHQIRSGLVAIPVPGHTRGSVVYLLEDKFLFTGDSLWWSRTRGELSASRTYCWYSWDKQIESLTRLAEYPFEWVLAGHGDRIRLPRSEARESLLAFTRRFSRA
jgi:glyoxylase-like metal-dependent hydrolase (beta-lactamase superfamily II)/ferredoxin